MPSHGARLCVIVPIILAITACAPARARTGSLSVADVHRFVDAHKRIGDDPDCAGLAPYFEEASDGLRTFSKITGSRTELCAAVRARPAAYAAVAAKASELETLMPRIREIYARYAEAFPEAMLPDVYVVVGRGWWGGTVRNGRIYIGLEAMGSVAGVPCVIAHEMAHDLQRVPRIGMLTGGPAFLRGSLLAHSVKEGAADLVAEVVTGCIPAPERREWAVAREKELWREFSAVMHRKEYRPWIYDAGADGRPRDLGYFFGYRIAQAWFDRAPDKAAALREILRIRDFDRFLRESRYDGAPPTQS